MDVHVDADAFVDAPGAGHAEVGHFGTDAGEGDEAFDGAGDVVVVLGVQDLGGEFDVAGFVVVEADFAD